MGQASISIGLIIIVVTYFMGEKLGWGSGPRDSLMVALTKKTGRSVRFIRNCIEILVFVLGYFVQLAFKLFKFDVNGVTHRFIEDDIRLIKGYIANEVE